MAGRMSWGKQGVLVWLHLIGLALGSHSLRDATHGLFISQELHGLDGLQVLVQWEYQEAGAAPR